MIDLTNLKQISRGNKEKELYYLRQFQELIPERLEQLTKSIEIGDLTFTKQVIHKMSPQLEFFGIDEIKSIKKFLESEKDLKKNSEIQHLLKEFIIIINQALNDVNDLILESFGKE